MNQEDENNKKNLIMNQEEEILPSMIRWDDQKANINLSSSSTIIPSWMVNENREKPYIYYEQYYGCP